MFKSERGFNINIDGIAKRISDNHGNLDVVKLITVPSVVRDQRRGTDSSQTPTLSEVGVARIAYGTGYEFCQVIAGTDGRPVNIDNVLFVTTDPSNSTINHGTVSVEIGSYFSIGWKRRADSFILIYRITHCEEWREAAQFPPEKDRSGAPLQPRPVAKLTCQLCGSLTRSWKGEITNIPPELYALYEATEERMMTDYPIPFYLDMIRLIADTPDSIGVADGMRQNLFDAAEVYAPDEFKRRLYQEILDIRKCQFSKPTNVDGPAKRRAGPIPAVEILELDTATDTILIDLVVPREADAMPLHLQTTLTSENFYDEATGRSVLERGLLLKCNTFEQLQSTLAGKRDQSMAVHLASIR